MKEGFTKYLEVIGITKTFQKRIAIIHEFYHEICPDELTDIFVTDYVTEDGSRIYENLWFFSDRFCMEAKQFPAKDDFDMAPIKSRIYYWTMQKQDYDFKKATEKSRLSSRFDLDVGILCNFKASKENCDYLRDIILKYVMPNLKK